MLEPVLIRCVTVVLSRNKSKMVKFIKSGFELEIPIEIRFVLVASSANMVICQVATLETFKIIIYLPEARTKLEAAKVFL